MGLRRGFKAEANRIALRIRDRMSLGPTDPIDPFEICTRYDIRVIRLSDIDPRSPFLHGASSAFSAVIVPCGH